MGFASFSEDIEELRNQREHFRTGIDNIMLAVSRSQFFSDLKRQEEDLSHLVRRVVKELESLKGRALTTFEEAEKMLSDPAVRIVKRLDKRESAIGDLKERLSEATNHLDKCRLKRIELEDRCKRLEVENSQLRMQNKNLKDNDVAWRNEMADVRRLPKS